VWSQDRREHRSVQLRHHRGSCCAFVGQQCSVGTEERAPLVQTVTTLNKPAYSEAYPETASEINPFFNPYNPHQVAAFPHSTRRVFLGMAFRIFHSGEHGANGENAESLMTAMRKRQRGDEDTSDFMTILAGAMLLLTGQGSSLWQNDPRST
jgi:hypothetical protein